MPRLPPGAVTLIALASAAAGWWLGRETAPTPTPSAVPPRPPAVPRAAPTLTGSREGGPRPGAPAAGPAPQGPEPVRSDAGPGPERASAEVPGKSAEARPLNERETAPRVLLPSFFGPAGAGDEPGTAVEEERSPAVREAERLLASEPEAARDRLEALLDSADPGDRRWAYRLLARARHPSQRDLVERAVREGRPDDDVRSLLRTLAGLKDRAWSAKQLTGAPDTPLAGDLETAWASKGPDMGEVWIDLTYAEEVVPEAVRVHETFNPGAVARLLAGRGDGTWTLLWSGEDPTREAPGWFEPRLEGAGFATRRLRLIVDTDRVPGWNELDAVELVGGGRRQWASDAIAGSSYAD